ncbi:hypothetical protein GCM10020331_003830 [Ectobacillus funiculus]
MSVEEPFMIIIWINLIYWKKLIEEHINELRKLCESAAELSFVEGNLIWFEYFERNYQFFSTMLTSKGAPAFRSHFLNFVIEELEGGNRCNQWKKIKD